MSKINSSIQTNKIALVCPGSRPTQVDYMPTLQQCIAAQTQQEVIYAEDCLDWLPAEKRADIFLNYLFDESISTIWAVRGGEGSADLISYLHTQQQHIRELPEKLLLGFSDFTALILYFAQTYGWQTVHGPGALQISENSIDANSKQHCLNLVQRAACEFSLDELCPLNVAAKSPHRITGTLSGGNLTLLTFSALEPWQLDSRDKILLIEDVHENPHAIIRALKYLQRTQLFDGCKGIIFGDFNTSPIGSTEEEQQHNADAIMTVLGYFAESCDFPVLYTQAFGHGERNLPIVFNRHAQLHIDANNAQLIY